MMDGLGGILLEFGGPILAKAVARKLGPDIGDLAGDALDALGKAFGTEPKEEAISAAIQKATPAEAKAKVKIAEADMAPVLLAQAEVMRQGNDQQRQTIDLLKEQSKTPGWRSDWLYAWQWFLLLSWGFRLLAMPLVNAAVVVTGGPPEAITLPVDLGTHITLTGLYLGLHMGGHTVLELVRNQWGGLFGKKDKAAE